MKVVAVFLLACIAVCFAYPTVYEESEMEVRPGMPMVYNENTKSWQPQAKVQEECDTGS